MMCANKKADELRQKFILEHDDVLYKIFKRAIKSALVIVSDRIWYEMKATNVKNIPSFNICWTN